MAGRIKKAEQVGRMIDMTGVFLANLKGKGPVDAVMRSMAGYERRQTDKALSALFDETASAGAASEGVRLAEVFARAATRVMGEDDLARLMPVAMLDRDVLKGLDSEGAPTLARLGRRALALSHRKI